MKEENTEYEKKMETLNNSVILIRNIDDEDFTHPYAGHPYTILAGQEKPFSYPVGMHLAQHLAKKILRKKQRQSEKTGDGKEVNMFMGTAIPDLVRQMIVEEIKGEPIAPKETDAEREIRRNREIEEQFNQKPAKASVKVDKKEIIKYLKDNKIKFNPRDSVEELNRLVIQHQMDTPAE